MPLMAAWRRFPEGRIGPTRIGRRRSSPVSCSGTRESGGLKLAGVTFEWDPRKAAANFQKHGVAFEDASSVFFDPLAMTYPAPADSLDEHREVTRGETMKKNRGVGAQCERGERRRIRSARPATRTERRQY